MKTLKIISVLSAVIINSTLTFCQTGLKEFPILKSPYLGQKPPGMTPEKFAPGIISTENAWEAAISFSPDLSELFFSYRASIEGMENRIMHMKMVNNVWTKPEPASFGQDITEYEAFITPDYTKVIYKSQRPNPNVTNKEGGIWYSMRENKKWGEPKYLSGPINKGWVMSVTSTLQGTLYFTGSYDAGYGIYKSRFINGGYTKPEYLPVEINKNKYFSASHPYISPDESYMIFDADGTTNSDLFISYRRKNGSWTDAIRLDSSINTGSWEGIATVSPDGKYLFFNRDNDIYWASTNFIEELRPKEK
jgi:hypothetical protein